MSAQLTPEQKDDIRHGLMWMEHPMYGIRHILGSAWQTETPASLIDWLNDKRAKEIK